MLKNHYLKTLAEICLIITLSATAGIAWNRTLLAGAWSGEVTQLGAVQQQPEQTGAPAAETEAVPMPIGLIQVKELHEAREAVLVDARSSSAYAEGHIPGAVLLPVDQARKDAHLSAAAKDATLIVYCNGFSCHDSMEVGKLLMKAGYSDVYVYEGGYPEWRDAGYPVAKGAS